jgi:hypothetical protein
MISYDDLNPDDPGIKKQKGKNAKSYSKNLKIYCCEVSAPKCSPKKMWY